MPVQYQIVPANAELAFESSWVPLDQAEYPYLSAFRVKELDDTTAFIEGTTGVEPLTVVEIYPRYSQLVRMTNLDDITDVFNVMEDTLNSLLAAVGAPIDGDALNQNIVDLHDTMMIVNSSLSAIAGDLIGPELVARVDVLTAAFDPLEPYDLVPLGLSGTTAAVDIVNYTNLSVQTTIGGGVVTIQTSNDGTNWYTEVSSSYSQLLVFSGVTKYMRAISTTALNKAVLVANK